MSDLQKFTVLLGKRVDFDHCVVSADSVLTMYTIRSMVGLPTCQIVECEDTDKFFIWR